MTMTGSVDLGALRASMKGAVIGPDDSTYDDARKVWNASIDRRPAAVARCESPADVSAAVTFARDQGLEIAVRGGAHSSAGASMVDDGLAIDVSALNQVSVDPAAKRVRVGGGALLSDMDAATQAHGLAVPAGVVSHTGVAGLTLGGGMGWLTRMGGLTIDNLVSAEVVIADGQVLRADENEHPDLFWAIRGGGGNFGVVTEFEFRLHKAGPMVQFGLLFWGVDDGPAALRVARDLIPTLPRHVNVIFGGLNAPPEPFVPEEHQHELGIAMIVVGFGSPEDHAEALARIRDGIPPLFEVADAMPYVALQQMLDEANGWGFHCYDKATYLADLSDEAIQVVMEHLPRKTSPMSVLLFYRLDGAYSEVGEDDTAFGGGRSPRYAVFIIAVCPVPELLAGEREWVRSSWEALSQHGIGVGSYVNVMSEFEDDRVRASYGPAKYDRLARIKRQYDPENLFHRNANIKPA